MVSGFKGIDERTKREEALGIVYNAVRVKTMVETGVKVIN